MTGSEPEVWQWLAEQSLLGVIAAPHGRVAWANARAEALLGYERGALSGRTLESLLGEGARRRSIAFRRPDRSTITIDVFTTTGQFEGNPAPIALLGDASSEADAARRRDLEAALRRSEERYALTALGANDALWEWDVVHDRFTVSDRWTEMIGLLPTDVGLRAGDWLSRVHPADRRRVLRQISDHLRGRGRDLAIEYRLQHANGAYRWMLMRGVSVRDAGGDVLRMAGSQTDVTARRSVEEKLRYDALHDTLTGLANRALLMDRLGHAIARRRGRKGTQFGVLCIDLDRFKMINESLGHTAGDQLLIATARRLERCVRPEDTVARLGGDEFFVLLEDVQDAQEGARVADRIHGELSQPVLIGGQDLVVTPSIGIVHGSPAYQTGEEVLRDADIAMYRAKSRGRAGHAEFEPAMHKTAVDLLQLESDLRRALQRDELVLFYQPVVELSTGRISGFEALVHWQHPQRGLLRPLQFVPLAEESGLVEAMGEWVLLEACRMTRAFQQRFGDLTVGVNLSPRQLRGDMVGTVARALRETQLPPRNLRLELTESMLMDDADRSVQLLAALRALGVSLDLDDFGTGYSSLSYLHNFRLDTLKIDRSFVARGGWEIVSAIVSLARGLRLTLIAEGVETRGQLEALRQMGCEYAQGYLFGRPLRPEDLSALLSNEPRARMGEDSRFPSA